MFERGRLTSFVGMSLPFWVLEIKASQRKNNWISLI